MPLLLPLGRTLVLGLTCGVAAVPAVDTTAPCSVGSHARYAKYLNLFALAPAPNIFQTAAVKEESSVSGVMSAVSSGAPTVVMFYAPWCPHCQSTKPVYDRVAQNVSGIHFLQIDASANSEVRERFGVSAYPTIKYFDGSPNALSSAATYDWHGAIEDDLKQFVLRQMPRQVRLLLT